MKTVRIALLVIIIIGLGLIFTREYWLGPFTDFIINSQAGQDYLEKSYRNDPKYATYNIDGRLTMLDNGRAEDPISKTSIRYFGNAASRDLTGDGIEDTAFILTQETGGSGTFYYLAAALGSGEGLAGTNAVFLGDRIAPQSTQIKDGQIIVNYAEREPDEPFTAAPSVGVSRYFRISDKALLIEANP